jgi:hypothetical protein
MVQPLTVVEAVALEARIASKFALSVLHYYNATGIDAILFEDASTLKIVVHDSLFMTGVSWRATEGLPGTRALGTYDVPRCTA